MAEPCSTSAPLLAAQGLHRNFGGLAAVRNVSIELRPGELHAVIGPNGAGKSTLVDLLSGHLRPSSGAIQLAGREVAGEPSWRMTQLGVGRSFQRTNIFASLSTLENVRLAALAIKLHPSRLFRAAHKEKTVIDAARGALERVGLDGSGHRLAGTLSHGEQRQLEIAMTLAANPKVLLLDEPLAGMGPEESEGMIRLLKGLAQEHAILLVEHDMDFVFAVADWMTVMVDGAVLAAGRPQAVRANAEVQRAYLGGHA
jgi:branched-chain amino acid transport system ATP-binding protein